MSKNVFESAKKNTSKKNSLKIIAGVLFVITFVMFFYYVYLCSISLDVV